MYTIADEIHKAEQIHHMAEQEHMETVESLIKSADKLNVVFESMNEGVLVANAEGNITNANQRLVNMLGYGSPDGLTGKAALDLVSTGDRDMVAEVIRRSLDKDDRVILGVSIIRADGSAFPGELSLSPLKSASNPRGLVAIIRDVTEIEQSEHTIKILSQNLKTRTAELEKINEEMKAFSASIANELKSPLRRVEGFSKAIMEDYSQKLDEQGNYYLHRIEAETHLMAQLVDDMLKLYTVTITEVSFNTIDLSALAREIAENLQNQANFPELKLIVQSDLAAYGDEQLLRAALEALFDNAIKFTRRAPQPEIEFGKTTYNGREAYFIKDNGVGFDMRFGSKLFKPFQRLHSEPEFKGNGVGLSIVQSIIKRHGGEVWAEGEKGKGAIFYFTLSERGN
jgi:PAS domain S-box-containing protein